MQYQAKTHFSTNDVTTMHVMCIYADGIKRLATADPQNYEMRSDNGHDTCVHCSIWRQLCLDHQQDNTPLPPYTYSLPPIISLAEKIFLPLFTLVFSSFLWPKDPPAPILTLTLPLFYGRKRYIPPPFLSPDDKDSTSGSVTSTLF